MQYLVGYNIISIKQGDEDLTANTIADGSKLIVKTTPSETDPVELTTQVNITYGDKLDIFTAPTDTAIYKWKFDGDNVDNTTNRLEYNDLTAGTYEAVCETYVDGVLTKIETFNIDPNFIIKMHKDTGTDYANKLILPAIVGCAKDVFGKWNAADVIAKREEATDFIVKGLKDKLQPYGINITLVELLDISFKPKFEDAVEAKQIAEQEASRAKNLTVKIKEEAEQKIIAAEAEAKAMAVRAKALEQNKSLVEYEAVMKWDGQLPQYMMGNSVPFINLDTKGVR
jgi:hypothetical protein